MDDGLRLALKVTPRAGRDCIDGISRDAQGRTILKVKVRAAPADGEANAALIRLIASAMGVAPSAVALVRGAANRDKLVHISGDPAALAGRLADITGAE